MTTSIDAIQAINAGDAAAFRSAVNDVLSDKMADRLEIEKMTVAQGLFGAAATSDEE